MNLKQLLLTHPTIKSIASTLFYRLCGNKVRVKGKNNEIIRAGILMRHCHILMVGNENQIIIDGTDLTRLESCHIIIHGNKNKVVIGKSVKTSINITIEDDNNCIILGDGFRGGANSELAAIEGTTISFGKDCMLSGNITLRTGDSHSILNKSTHKRTNRSRSIVIGDHVWIGNTVLIFKGVQIGSHSIVGGGSVVSGKMFPENSLIAGNPAVVVREDVDWTDKRIPIE